MAAVSAAVAGTDATAAAATAAAHGTSDGIWDGDSDGGGNDGGGDVFPLLPPYACLSLSSPAFATQLNTPCLASLAAALTHCRCHPHCHTATYTRAAGTSRLSCSCSYGTCSAAAAHPCYVRIFSATNNNNTLSLLIGRGAIEHPLTSSFLTTHYSLVCTRFFA